MARLCGNLQQRFGSCLEQDTVDDSLIRKCQRPQLGWQREHHVKIRHVEQFGLPRSEPSRAGRSLALGAMAIATGVVGKPALPAGVASFFVAAEGGRPTGGQVAERLPLLAPHDRAVAGQQFAADGAKDIAYLRSCGGTAIVASASKGLATEAIRSVDTAV